MINNPNYYLPALYVRIIRTQKLQYLINKNYSTLTSKKKKSLTDAWCWVIPLADHRNVSNVYIKKQVLLGTCNTNQNVDIDSPASRGGEGNCMKYVIPYLGFRLSQQCQLTWSSLLKNNFWELINKIKEDCNQWQIMSFLKMFIFQKYARQFNTSWFCKQILPY